jgi:hypothetical protein
VELIEENKKYYVRLLYKNETDNDPYVLTVPGS